MPEFGTDSFESGGLTSGGATRYYTSISQNLLHVNVSAVSNWVL